MNKIFFGYLSGMAYIISNCQILFFLENYLFTLVFNLLDCNSKIHAKNAYVFINPFQTFVVKLYIYM